MWCPNYEKNDSLDNRIVVVFVSSTYITNVLIVVCCTDTVVCA